MKIELTNPLTDETVKHDVYFITDRSGLVVMISTADGLPISHEEWALAGGKVLDMRPSEVDKFDEWSGFIRILNLYKKDSYQWQRAKDQKPKMASNNRKDATG